MNTIVVAGWNKVRGDHFFFLIKQSVVTDLVVGRCSSKKVAIRRHFSFILMKTIVVAGWMIVRGYVFFVFILIN